MVKEFRALSRAEAVESMYQDMAARHRARFRNVQILRVAEIEKKEDVRRAYIKQLLEPGLKFPLPHRRTTSKNWFAASRPVSRLSFYMTSDLTLIVLVHLGLGSCIYCMMTISYFGSWMNMCITLLRYNVKQKTRLRGAILCTSIKR